VIDEKKKPETTTAHVSVLDLVLKYGVVFAGIAYFAGLIELSSDYNVYNIGTDELLYNLSSSRIIYIGSWILVPFLFLTLLPFLVMTACRNRSIAWACVPISIALFDTFAASGSEPESKGTLVLSMLALTLTCLIVTFVLMSTDGLSVRKQATVTLIFLVGLYTFAYNVGHSIGRYQWDTYTPNIRILVAPDAKIGVEKLGLMFEGHTETSEPALSVPVEEVFTTDHSAVVRLPDKRIISLRLDKIWGMVDISTAK